MLEDGGELSPPWQGPWVSSQGTGWTPQRSGGNSGVTQVVMVVVGGEEAEEA